MNSVSNTTGGGLPQYLVDNVPAESQYGLNITQPAIYFGEVTPGYQNRRIPASKSSTIPRAMKMSIPATTGTGEFRLTAFGKGCCLPGRKKTSIFCSPLISGRKAGFRYGEMFRNACLKFAPFLLLDHDPYAVLSEGKLYWIQDAYTISDRFPYSASYSGDAGSDLNYIRNSVKVVVDMYDGTVSFYVMDSKDPVLAIYRRAFPGVFKDLSQISPDLKSHLRYPEDLFGIQTHDTRPSI